jgi:hypothetical protein
MNISISEFKELLDFKTGLGRLETFDNIVNVREYVKHVQ